MDERLTKIHCRQAKEKQYKCTIANPTYFLNSMKARTLSH